MRISHAIRKERKIKLIEEFYNEYGRLPSWNQIYQGVNLGNFLISIRRGFTKISEEQLSRLSKLGFTLEIKNKEEGKMQKIELVEEFYQEYGRLPKWNQTYKGVKLGKFLASIRQKDTCITQEQLNRLLRLGFEMDLRDREVGKEEKVKLVEEFYEEYKRLPKFRETYKGVKIGVFLSNVKQRNYTLTEEQMNRLIMLGFDMRVKNKEKEKEEKVELVEEFYEEYGRLPYEKDRYKNVAIGQFLNSMKQGNTQVTEEQMKRLIVLGFDMRVKDKEKEEKVKLVEEFYAEYGRLPYWKERYKNVAIGQFLNNIKHGGTQVTEEQMKRLIVLGFDMTVKDKEKEKEEKITLIEEFYKEYGRLPKRYEIYKEEAVGHFLNNMEHGITKITEEQMERLIKLGFQGQTNDIMVNRKIKQVEQFYKINNRLPEQDEKLGKEKPKVGEFLLSIKIGKVRITESQFLRLQQMDATLTREQVKFIEKPKTLIKK